GTGKSTALQYWATQDILRGDAVIIFDPKNDPDVLISVYQACQIADREKDLRILHLGHPVGSDRYNPVGRFERVTEVANRVTGRLSSEGESAVFREFAWVYINTITRAIQDLKQRLDYSALLDHARDIGPLAEEYLLRIGGEKLKAHRDALLELKRNELAAGERAGLREYTSEILATVKAYRETKTRPNAVAESLIRLLNVGPSHLDKLIQSLFPFLERLCTGPAAWLLSSETDSGRSFDWETIIQERGVVYIGLDALTDADVASAVGAAMFADLTALAGKRYNAAAAKGSPLNQPIRIYADELSELLGKEFIQLVNKGRGAGLSITAFAQSLFDVESAIGSPARARVVLENFNNLLMFRVRNEQTAAAITDGLPQVTIQTQMVVSSTQDNPSPETDIDFTSSTQIRLGQERVPLLSSADIKQLPRGECFGDLEGGRIVKLRLPWLIRDQADLPRSLNEMTAQMRKRYRSSEAWANFSIDIPVPTSE
ncbi:MAG: conjugative transfer system coupling protein TraD, partial [Pseudomonadota bacterium]